MYIPPLFPCKVKSLGKEDGKFPLHFSMGQNNIKKEQVSYRETKKKPKHISSGLPQILILKQHILESQNSWDEKGPLETVQHPARAGSGIAGPCPAWWGLSVPKDGDYNLSAQPIPMFDHPHSKKQCFFGFRWNLVCFVSLISCPATGHYLRRVHLCLHSLPSCVFMHW